MKIILNLLFFTYPLLIFFISLLLRISFIKKYNKDEWIKILKRKHKLFKLFKGYSGCIMIILCSLIGLFLLLKFYSNENLDIVSAYCNFLVFIATFMIGFYIHKNEESNEEKEKKDRCLRLKYTLFIAYSSLQELDSVKPRKSKIIYDKEWYKYMIEYLELVNYKKIFETQKALTEFFAYIDRINKELENQNFEKAVKIKEEFDEEQNYMPIEYNIFNVISDIDDYAVFYDVGKWVEDRYDFTRFFFARRQIKEENLKEYVKDYFKVVETLIYNELLKNGKTSVYEVNKKIIDKLYSNEFLKERVLHEIKFYDKQVVSHIVWKISKKINDKSQIIDKKHNYYILKIENENIQ